MSELGILSQCLVDSDAEALDRARRLRRKALVISVALEIALLAALLLWPLVTPGELPRQFNVTPAPPFPGSGAARPADSGQTRSRERPPIGVTIHLHHPTIVTRQSEEDDAEPPSLEYGSGSPRDNISGATGSGPNVLGATGDRPIVIPPPEQTHHSAPFARSEGVMEAMLIHRPQPIYPPIARAMHLAGTVILRATIATDGSVQSLVVVSGNPILAQAAVAAVREWRYRPTLLSGQAVEVETQITVKFVLE